MDLSSREWCLPNGATPEAISALRKAAPDQLPSAYFDLLSFTNGGEGPLPRQPFWFLLYEAEYVAESILVERYNNEFSEFFIFGSNGGGEFLAFDLRQPEPFPIVYVDMVAGPESAASLAPTFEEFVRLLGQEEASSTDQFIAAWNNLMRNEPSAFEKGSDKRAAAIAARYMALANNGGINSFLTCSNELDAAEVLEALVSIGALTAAKEFGHVLRGLGGTLPAASQKERFYALAALWSESLNQHDVLSKQADDDIVGALKRHVERHLAFYEAGAHSQ